MKLVCWEHGESNLKPRPPQQLERSFSCNRNCHYTSKVPSQGAQGSRIRGMGHREVPRRKHNPGDRQKEPKRGCVWEEVGAAIRILLV